MAARRFLTGDDSIRTEHRPATQTPLAPAAGSLNPRHTDAVADAARPDAWSNGDDLPNRLVSEDAREWSRQVTVGLMHVREAQAARMDRDQHPVGTRIRCGNLFDFPSASYGWNDRSFHGFSFFSTNP
jgi:hypothetical protein